MLLVFYADALRWGGRMTVGSHRTETWGFLWSHFALRWHLLVDHSLPFRTALQDHPVGGVLWAKDLFMATLLLPLQLLVGLPIAFMTEQWLLFLLAAGGAFLLARQLGIGRWPAVLAATSFALCPHMLGETYNGNLEAMAMGWAPLWLWALVSVVQRPTVARAVRAALLLFLLLLNNQYYAMGMVIPSAVVLALLWWQRRREPGQLAILLAVGAAVAVGAGAFVPLALFIEQSLAAPDSLALVGSASLAPPNTTDLLHFVQPGAPLPHLDRLAPPFHDLVYPGFALLVLGLAAPALGRRDALRWAWPALALVFLILSVGPALQYEGRLLGEPGEPILTPWSWLMSSGLPLTRFTMPHRMAVLTGLFLSMGLAWTLEGLAERLRARVPGGGRGVAIAQGVLVVAVLAEMLVIQPCPIPFQTMETWPAPHAITLGRAEAEGAVLNYPLYLGQNPRRIYFWYQHLHERPVDMAIRVGPLPTVATRVPLVWELLQLQDPARTRRPGDAPTDRGLGHGEALLE